MPGGGCPFAATINLFYDGLSNAVAVTLTAPLERVIIRHQVTGSSKDGDNNNKKDATTTTNGSTNIPTTLSSIVAIGGGIWSLWKWNSVEILNITLGNYLSTNYFQPKFYSALLLVDNNDNTKKKKEDDDDKQLQQQQRHVVVSRFFGSVSSFVVLYPLKFAFFTLVASNNNTNNSKRRSYDGVQDCLSQNISKNGMLSVFTGVTAATVGFMINYLSMYYMSTTYAKNKKKEDDDDDGSKRSRLQLAIQQVIIPTIAKVLAYPLETLSRRQILALEDKKSVDIYSNLYDGNTTNILKSVAANSILVMYDYANMDIMLRRIIMKLFH